MGSVCDKRMGYTGDISGFRRHEISGDVPEKQEAVNRNGKRSIDALEEHKVSEESKEETKAKLRKIDHKSHGGVDAPSSSLSSDNPAPSSNLPGENVEGITCWRPGEIAQPGMSDSAFDEEQQIMQLVIEESLRSAEASLYEQQVTQEVIEQSRHSAGMKRCWNCGVWVSKGSLVSLKDATCPHKVCPDRLCLEKLNCHWIDFKAEDLAFSDLLVRRAPSNEVWQLS